MMENLLVQPSKVMSVTSKLRRGLKAVCKFQSQETDSEVAELGLLAGSHQEGLVSPPSVLSS